MIVAESYSCGESISVIARRHGLTPQQLFAWRRADGTTRVWRAGDAPQTDFSTSEAANQIAALIAEAHRLLPRCLPPNTLQEAFLTEPPKWCERMFKWPYDGSLR